LQVDKDANGRGGTRATLTVRLDYPRTGVLVIQASGRLDAVTAPGLRHLLDDQLAAAPPAIVLDLSSLSVLGPGAVHVLVHVACSAGEADIGLGLVTIDEATIGALVTADVNDLFDIHPSIEAARRALRFLPPRSGTWW
jgi:anti-sigma B factor antagonist